MATGSSALAVLSSQKQSERRSWYWRDPKGKHPNKDWLKSQLRAADRGNHEWIPTSCMLAVMKRAEQNPKEMAKGALWIHAQHLLRSPTPFIIFEPGDYGELGEAVKKLNAGELSAEEAEAIFESFESLETIFSGHKGALYLEDPDDPQKPVRPVIAGQPRFHADLEALFKSEMSVLEYTGELIKFAKKKVWNGKTGFPANLSSLTRVPFKDGSGAPLQHINAAIQTLHQLELRQQDAYRALVSELGSARKELIRLTAGQR